jgi:nicotinate-nucleotide--dimethylbenzimidazole phosphoribosyltransferase
MKIEEQLQHKINHKTKPLGALGSLEAIALKIGAIQNTLTPQFSDPHIVVFAGDHGITKEGVSAYPAEVTHQMVLNFLNGGAAINVFAKQNSIGLKIIDAGVAKDFEKSEGLINYKVGFGTRSFLTAKAMTKAQLDLCMLYGNSVISHLQKTSKCNIVGFGEMGIGNTSAATMLMHYFTNISLTECIGRGTGLNDEQLKHKINILISAKTFHGSIAEPLEIIQAFAGFEMAQMCGAMLAAFEQGLILLIDGFIASSVLLACSKINPEILNNAIFCHQSDEVGHAKLLKYLNAEPILKLNMRVGEGTGCAVAYPIMQSAVNFLNEMASFESANVSNKS